LPSTRVGTHRIGMAAPTYYTADTVRALPDDGNRYEVVYGADEPFSLVLSELFRPV
jgi:hypothetical protein